MHADLHALHTCLKTHHKYTIMFDTLKPSWLSSMQEITSQTTSGQSASNLTSWRDPSSPQHHNSVVESELFHEPLSSFIHPSFAAHLPPKLPDAWKLAVRPDEGPSFHRRPPLGLQNQHGGPPEGLAAAPRAGSLATDSLGFNLTGAMIANICKRDAEYLPFRRAVRGKNTGWLILCQRGERLRTAGGPTERALECRLGLSVTQRNQNLCFY